MPSAPPAADTLPRAVVQLLSGAKSPATPWTGRNRGALHQAPSGYLSLHASWAILDKKLAASVNILPKTSSLYFWKGKIEESTEILLLIKTKTSKVSRLSTYMRLAHPFEIPEVFSIPMDQGDARYLKWLEEAMKEN
ncbi:protein CutA homolog isoform X2 [Peromyscus maniculatus bairdii]|uniref:protein CutA homolog isoform X2 n=1 Tax=Peromyscus maniculatus bairdii TaxID=230844 RepID=UPI003FD6036D